MNEIPSSPLPEKHEFHLYKNIKGYEVNKSYSDWKCSKGHDLCLDCGYCHVCLFHTHDSDNDNNDNKGALIGTK